LFVGYFFLMYLINLYKYYKRKVNVIITKFISTIFRISSKCIERTKNFLFGYLITIRISCFSH
jgi:hypothetical protein